MIVVLAHFPVYYAGGGFPWGFLIIGGILYFLWRNGAFGGPGRHWNGPRFGGGYGPGYGPGQPPQPPAPGQDGGPMFQGPRAVFDEWHRQAHESAAATQTPPAPGQPSAPPSQTGSGNGESV
jgi:hypothetical protein